VTDTAAPASGDQTRSAPAYAWAADAAAVSAKRGTTPATPLAMNPPVYPRDALDKGVSGKVLLLVDVDAAGRVSDVALSGHGSGDAALDQAAMAAARQWRFVPAKARGRAIASRMKIPVNFDLGMQPADAPQGMANAARYNWYLLDMDGDPRNYRCDILYTPGTLGGSDPVYCGFAIKVATR
jgi:TonB family protein